MVTVTGSSPLARGTRIMIFVSIATPRLIPARAGNTRSGKYDEIAETAHPRSRGEHGGHDANQCADDGSSPLARGTRCALRRARVPGRLIPARAGNTGISSLVIWCFPAHPRSRGEHSELGIFWYPYQGSSPLARGTPLSVRLP